jgi:sulfite dehydrogenase (quinone) subunit SoeC
VLTAPVYVALGLASGAVLLRALLALVGEASPWSAWLAMLLLAIGAALKWGYWLRIDGELRAYTIEAATGLGHLGKVHVLDPPHTQPNFVMREMGYRIARKHAQLLRKWALLFAFGLPIVLLLISRAGWLAMTGALLAMLSMAVDLVIERWLFFAEAEHVSMLYWGKDTA